MALDDNWDEDDKSDENEFSRQEPKARASSVTLKMTQPYHKAPARGFEDEDDVWD
jgi:hypothetical protein